MRLSTSRPLSWVPILLALFGLASGASAQGRSAVSPAAQAPAGLEYQSASRNGMVVLYDQIQIPAQTSGVVSQNNVTATTYDNSIADDFIVPAGATWNVAQVFARGFYTGTGGAARQCTTGNITFYNNGPGEPGTVIGTQSVAPTDATGALTFILTPVTLTSTATSGTRYWMSVTCNGPGLDLGVLGRWNWFNNTNVRGLSSQLINPNGGFGQGPGWEPVGSDRDFSLSGSSSGTALFPELVLNPASIDATVATGGTTTGTIGIQNTGDADLLFSFTGFAALQRIRELTARGFDLNRQEISMDIPVMKGSESIGMSASPGLQYRVGGPDANGYVFIDSNEPNGPTYNWVDISTTGTDITPAAPDDGVTTVTLPFPFTFYGTDYTTATIGANGAMSFTATAISFSNATIPTPAAPNQLIAPFWDDLHMGRTGRNSSMRTQDMGDGRFVISWINGNLYNPSAGNTSNVTFQVILSQDGGIKFQYETISQGDATSTLASATTGIEGTGADGQALLVNYNTADYITAGLAIEFSQPPAFITSVSPLSGSVAPGTTTQVTVGLSANESPAFAPTAPGVYNSFLTLSTNDADEFQQTIPVRLTVTPPATGGDLVVTPNPVSTTLASGATGTAMVTLTNNTAAPVPFSFPQYLTARPATRAAVPQAPATATLQKGQEGQAGPAVNRGGGGPDAFGYEWIDSNEPGGPTANFQDISTTGTTATIVAYPSCTAGGPLDEGRAQVTLPQAFSFYGQDYSQVYVNVNGIITLDPAATGCVFSNKAIPTVGAPDALIAPFWDDLDLSNGGSIQTQAMPNGDFIVQWTNAGRFAGTSSYTFQAVLSRSGAIRYEYGTMTGTLNSATVGIENQAGTDGLQIAFNTAYAATGLAVLIQARPSFVTSVTPPSGTIPANGSVQVAVGFDATGLVAGQYTGEVDLVTPDSTVSLGVVLNVTGMPTVTVAPDPIAFGDVIVGTSDSTSVTITNNGTSDLTVTSVTSSNAAFTVDVTTPLTIAPGATDSLEVTFTPTAVGAATGTLSIVSNATTSPNTVALSGNGLAPPAFSVSPASLTFTVDRGTVSAPQTLTLSNTGAGSGTFASDVVFAPARPLPANNGPLQALAKGETGATDLVGALGFQPGAGLPSVSYAGRGGVDCNAEPGIIIHDDGTAENGYSGNVASVSQVTLVDRFTPANYPATFTSVCAAFITQAGGGSTIPFEVVAYDDDGAGGAPGTLLGTMSATATGIPAIAAGAPIPIVYQTVDISGLDLNIEAGTVYIGVRFAPRAAPNVFLASDESTGHPVGFAGGYFGTVPTAGGPVAFSQLGTAATFPNYRAQFIRAVEGPAGPATVTLSPEAGTVAAGGSQAIAVTVDATGSEVGTYQAQIVITTNDPAHPVLTVPVTIIVQEVVAGEGQADLPAEVTLYQNYPNPVSQATRIKFALPAAAAVDVRVFDVAGRMVATLMQGEQTAGFHEVSWDASAMASGVYFVRMQAGTEMRTMRLSVIR